MDNSWKKLNDAAQKVLYPREISDLVEAGGVAAAIETAAGNVYVGVCVDTACTLGICAERNAIFSMITDGEHVIRRVVAIDRNGKAIPPCGACRELLTQLMPGEYRNVEILLDRDRVVTLGDLTPEWWI